MIMTCLCSRAVEWYVGCAGSSMALSSTACNKATVITKMKLKKQILTTRAGLLVLAIVNEFSNVLGVFLLY
jgi:hypothetical protein